jgi:hypothetical protein
MRGRSRADLADMLVKLGLERLHQLLKILQRGRGLRTIIRDGGAKVAIFYLWKIIKQIA